MRKRIVAGILLLFSHTILFAQASGIEWQKCLGGTRDDRANFIRQTGDGGYIIAAKTNSGDGDVTSPVDTGAYWIIKLDHAGNIEWQKKYGGSNVDAAYCITEHSGGGYISAGETWSFDGQVSGNHGASDFWIVRLDDTGAITWQTCLGGSGVDVAYSIQKTLDEKYIVAGNSNSTDGQVTGNHGGNDIWVAKLYATGSIMWQKSLGGSQEENTYNVIETSDSNYVLIGSTSSNDGDITNNHGDYDCWIVKLDHAGGIVWQKCFGGSGYDAGYAIRETPGGGYVFAGTSASTDGDVSGNLGFQDYWIAKINDTGKILWQRSIGGTMIESAFDIQNTYDGGYIVAGISSSNDVDVSGNHGNGGQNDVWAVKLNDTGGIVWQRCLGGPQVDVVSSVQQTSEGGYIFAGYTFSDTGDVTGNHGYVDAWVVKLSRWPEGIGEVVSSINILITPNPSDGHFTITLPGNSSKAELTVINMLGEVVLQKVMTNANIDVSIPKIPGMYFVRVNADNVIYTSKLLIQ